jgi:transcriptional regulator with XRE-family HTH domain
MGGSLLGLLEQINRKISMNEIFSERLKEARGDRTQAEFCKLIGVKQGTYSTWELGKFQPSYGILTNIARLTSKTVDWFLGNGDSFRDRLRKAREAIGLSPKELADRIKMKDFYVAGLESGKIHPTDGIVRLLANTLGVTVEYLRCNESTCPNPDERKPFTFECAGCINKDEKITRLEADVSRLIKTVESLARRDELKSGSHSGTGSERIKTSKVG